MVPGNVEDSASGLHDICRCQSCFTKRFTKYWWCPSLTHWGRVMHICVGNLTSIGADNGLSPSRRQAIIWTNAGILLIGPRRANFNDILIKIQQFAIKKMHLKMLSAKWQPFCLGLNVLKENLSGSAGFYTKGHPLIKSNLIGPSEKLSWQPGCPVSNINIQGNFCISQGYGSSDNLTEN